MTKTAKVTLVGLIAPIGWGTTVGVIRDITVEFGLAAGLTLLYGAIVVLLLALTGCPSVKKFPKKYLIWGMPFATICSICFCASMYLCQDQRQTVEVGMVNYLWPSLVIIFSIIINGQKARWWIVPGLLVSMCGIMIVLGGSRGVDLGGIAVNIAKNPASYFLAFMGALSWAVYSNLTRKWADGQDPTIYIFAIDFAIFGAIWLMGYGDISKATAGGWISIILGAFSLGIPYAVWNWAVSRANMTVISIASFFIPVLSCVFASIWIGAKLDPSLMTGVFVLVVGSVLTWTSTKYANAEDGAPSAAHRPR